MIRLLLLLGMITSISLHAENAPGLVRLPAPRLRGSALAVRVPDGALLFTGQIFAREGGGDVRRQTEQAFDELAAVLGRAGTDLGALVRLNVYVTEDAATTPVEETIAARCAGALPAVTLVRSPLAKAGALVAVDAVAAVRRAVPAVEFIDGGAIMPAGGKAFVSGQAEKGADLAESVTLTMQSLHRSLEQIGLKRADVVQVKAFIRPFESHATAIAAIERSYAGGKVPPIVLLEWLTGSPTEIELVAAVPPSRPAAEGPLEYLWLPGMSVSPLYCRIATVRAGVPLVFLAGIRGQGPTPRDEWKDAYAQLGSALFEAGSSFRHLVKATYYLSDSAGRAGLGAIRPTYYDPARPPAASALEVRGLGHPGRAMLDMIAVPVR